jgi:hypothetical protein
MRRELLETGMDDHHASLVRRQPRALGVTLLGACVRGHGA